MSGQGLRLDLGLKAPDEIYQALLQLADNAGERAAPSVPWALALVLANHIGDDAVVGEAIALVAAAIESSRSDGEPRTDDRIVVSEALRRFFAQHPDDGMPGFAA